MSKKTGIIAMVISVVSLICSVSSIANMMQMKAAQAVPALEAVQETASVETPLDTASMETALDNASAETPLDTASVAATPDTEAEDTQAGTRDTAAQYVMYVGTNDKDTYKPEHTNEEAMNIVDQICLKYFDGYTLQDATGSWTDETGTPTHEYTLVCYFDAADEATVYEAADSEHSADREDRDRDGILFRSKIKTGLENNNPNRRGNHDQQYGRNLLFQRNSAAIKHKEQNCRDCDALKIRCGIDRAVMKDHIDACRKDNADHAGLKALQHGLHIFILDSILQDSHHKKNNKK